MRPESYDEGYEAYSMGVSLDANPYPADDFMFDGRDYYFWKEGWLDAQRDSKQSCNG